MSHTPLARQSRKSTLHYLPSPHLRANGQSSTPVRSSNLANTGSQTTPAATSSAYTTPQSKNLSHTHRTPISYSVEGESSASPWTPSRSARVPFDMKASMRAAQAAEREQATIGSPAPMAQSKKRRIVRKRSLWDRISSWPHDMIDTYFPDSITPPVHWAMPIAVLLHILHFLFRAPLFSSGTSKSDSILRRGERDRWEGRFGDGHGSSSKAGSILGSWSTILYTLLVLAIAISNAFYVFTRFRRYDMQLRSAKDSNRLNSPNAHAVPAPGRDDVFSDPEPQSTSTQAAGFAAKVASISWKVLKSMVLHLLGYDSAQTSPNPTSTIQSLNVWDPPSFNLVFFCYFPPPAPLLSYLLYPSNPFLTPFLHVIITLQTLYLTRHFQQLVKDRQYLTAEVMREYDQRFVYPKVFAATKDKGVMTHESEIVW